MGHRRSGRRKVRVAQRLFAAGKFEAREQRLGKCLRDVALQPLEQIVTMVRRIQRECVGRWRAAAERFVQTG